MAKIALISKALFSFVGFDCTTAGCKKPNFAEFGATFAGIIGAKADSLKFLVIRSNLASFGLVLEAFAQESLIKRSCWPSETMILEVCRRYSASGVKVAFGVVGTNSVAGSSLEGSNLEVKGRCYGTIGCTLVNFDNLLRNEIRNRNQLLHSVTVA